VLQQDEFGQKSHMFSVARSYNGGTGQSSTAMSHKEETCQSQIAVWYGIFYYFITLLYRLLSEYHSVNCCMY